MQNQLRQKVISHLINGVIHDGTGASMEIVPDRPSQLFYIGTLSPRYSDVEVTKTKTKLSPNSIGVEFLAPEKNDLKANVRINCSFYYRLIPPYEEQKQVVDIESSKVKLKQLFKRVDFDKSFDIALEKELTGDEFSVSTDLTPACAELWKKCTNQEDFLPPFNMARPNRPKIRKEELQNEKKYLEAIEKNSQPSFNCPWAAKATVEGFRTTKGWHITVSLENSAVSDRKDFFERAIFNSNIEAKLANFSPVPFDLDYFAESYKHNRKINASGINCAAEASGDSIKTVHTPIFEEKKIIPIEFKNTSFLDLEKNPIQTLRGLEAELRLSSKKYVDDFSSSALNDKEKKKFEEDVSDTKQEIERFERGIGVIEKCPKALESFRLMNKVFIEANNTSTKEYTKWRPFQIVFIVSVIPDLLSIYETGIACSRDLVDVLYFPTGGGKTEAFLGLAIFQAFLDRFYGKKFGISTITKFPLRMLSLQQLQRIADLFAQAENIRKTVPAINSKENAPFSLGYYVGSQNTPNRYIENVGSRVIDHLEEYADDQAALKKYLMIKTNPFTGKEPVSIKVNKAERRIVHYATVNGKDMELPIFISDEEIYRYLPTFIVSTLDKMAIVSWNKEFKNLLGAVKYKCPIHGYSSTKKCITKKCEVKMDDFLIVKEKNLGPALLIQDEMHLIRETLGSFDSHYETAIDELLFRISNHRIKIIGASATLSETNYKNHIKDLYARPGQAFPANIDLYMAKSDEVRRIIVGIMPHSFTPINCLERLTTKILSEIRLLLNDPNYVVSTFGKVDEKELVSILLDFYTLLSYHIRRNDAYQFSRSFSSRVKEPYLAIIKEKIPAATEIILQKRIITGDLDFDQLSEVMDSIENKGGAADNKIDLLLATSVISHGVDIDRLNIMTFMGMPQSNAEYIQALSRSGRARQGVSFIIFNPTRERDRSYFKYMKKFNELSNLLIEPTPICRWSESAVSRTSTGIFCGIVINYLELNKPQQKRPIYMVKGFEKAFMDQTISLDEIVEIGLKAYKIDQSDDPAFYESLIKEKFRQCFDLIINEGHKRTDSNDMFVPMLDFVTKPLNNFRDVEEGVDLILKDNSMSILRRGHFNSDRTDD